VLTDLVVASAELIERLARLTRTRVELPLLALERLVKTLQQPELSGRAIADPHVDIALGNMALKISGHKARTVVGHQKQTLRELAVNTLSFST
jgi:hypothetical protein